MAPKKSQKKTVSDVKLNEKEEAAVEMIDPTQLLIIIKHHKRRNEELKELIADLEKDIKKDQDKNLYSSYQVSQGITQNKDEYKINQNNIDNSKIDMEKQKNNLIDLHDSKIKSMSDGYEQKIKQKNDEIKKMEDQITHLKGYSIREKQYMEEKEALIKMMKETVVSQQEEILKVQRQEEKQRHIDEIIHNEKIDCIMKKARQQAEKGTKDNEDRIRQENEKLQQELNTNLDELSHVNDEKLEIVQENQEYDDYFEKNSEQSYYEQKNHQQNQKLKRMKEKLDYLKNYTVTEIQNFSKEVSDLKENHVNKIQDLQYQIKNLMEKARIKEKETRNIKGLMQMILDQRSDVEEWFLEGFYEIKNEMQLNEQTSQSLLPDISKKSSRKNLTQMTSQKSLLSNKSSRRGLQQQDKLDINQFTEQQQDKLLKILFSKMNEKVMPTPWRFYTTEGSSLRQNNTQNNFQSPFQNIKEEIDKY